MHSRGDSCCYIRGNLAALVSIFRCLPRMRRRSAALIYYLTRVASWLAGHIARPVRLALAGPITVLVYYAWAAKRRATIANMAQVLGVPENDPRAKRLARQSWRNYGRYISDFFYLTQCHI